MSTVEQLTEDVANAREQRDEWHRAFEKLQEGYRRVYQQCQTERQLKDTANEKLRAAERVSLMMRAERDQAFEEIDKLRADRERLQLIIMELERRQ